MIQVTSKVLLWFGIASVLTQIATADRDTYTNPVLNESGDPFCLEDKGWYYLYLPVALNEGGQTGGGVTAFKSQNLITWQSMGIVYKNGGQSHDGKQARSLWAPEVHKIKGRYYIYCTFVMEKARLNDKDIVVIEGDSPLHFDPATRKVLLGADAIDLNLYLDPTVFQDEDDKLYLIYKKRLGPGSMLCVRPMSDPKTTGDPERILFKSTDVPQSHGILEQPCMIKENGAYILFFSYGVGETSSYKIGCATSSSPAGPFVLAKNNPLMFTKQSSGVIAPGATSIVRDGAGRPWMVYRQKIDSSRGWDRVVCINRCDIRADGTVDIVATRSAPAVRPIPLKASSH